jgi:hypothetical protein
MTSLRPWQRILAGGGCLLVLGGTATLAGPGLPGGFAQSGLSLAGVTASAWALR